VGQVSYTPGYLTSSPAKTDRSKGGRPWSIQADRQTLCVFKRLAPLQFSQKNVAELKAIANRVRNARTR
jgi:hypothetical protein